VDLGTRRNFLRDLGVGTVGLAAERGQGAQMPGQPRATDAERKANAPSDIMAIAAHPGDAFFTMGAAVAVEIQLGAKAVFLSLSLGEKGSATIAPIEYGKLQQTASERAAHMLGAQAAFLDYRDGEIPASEEAKLAVCDLIREHKPAIVVTHWHGSWHKDHRACHAIVSDGVFYAGLPALDRKLPAHAVERIFFAENWEDAEGFEPDTFLDITPVFERWSEACAAFPMWRGETGFRYNDYYRSLAVCRGCLGRSHYAVALMSAPEERTQHVQAL